MQTTKVIHGETEEAIFEQIAADFAIDPGLLTYQALITQGSTTISLLIDIDLGGGFEGGFEITRLSARLQSDPALSFSIYHQGALAEIGKFFGMQDVVTGYPEFDEKVIVKTGDAGKLKQLFVSDYVRQTFGSLVDFTLKTIVRTTDETENIPFLEFEITRVLKAIPELKAVYGAFVQVLAGLDNSQHLQANF